MLWFMTDPRFYDWLWQMEDEIRPLMPMVYYHVWDNFPAPIFNKPFYDSNDYIITISKVTDEIVRTVSPDVSTEYLPHAVNSDVFKKLPDEEINSLREQNFAQWGSNKKTIFFWNNRNARRKMSGSVIWWFKEFLDKVGHDKACLLMHTDPHDSNGPNLEAMIGELGLTNGEIVFSRNKVAAEAMAAMYNLADCTINISDAEGFGLATLESLSCETPIIVSMTGGLQEQVTDGEEWFGIGIEPASKAVIGSQQVPFIYEDRVSKEDFIAALEKIFNMTNEERRDLGKKGREHVKKNYNFEDFNKRWVTTIEKICKEHGSWDTREGVDTWVLKEVA